MKHFSPLPLLPLLLALALFLSACAGRQAPADPETAQKSWQAMAAASAAPAPFRDSLTLRFGTEGNTRRVTAVFWGNGDRGLRLDVSAGVGAGVGKLAQVGSHFLLYAPLERKAFFYEGTSSPLFRAGIPLPFDLFRLEALLHGRWLEAFGESYDRVSSAPKGCLAYDLSGGLGGVLTLSPEGLPQRWSSENWTMLLVLDEKGLIKRLDLTSLKGDKAVVLVKQREKPAPFTEAQMRLELPDGTELRPLEDMTRGR